MPTSSAPVDPQATGHPVAVTRSLQDAPITTGASSRVAETPKEVYFATEETSAGENVKTEASEKTAGGLFSVPDFAHSSESKEEDIMSPSEVTSAPAVKTEDGTDSNPKSVEKSVV